MLKFLYKIFKKRTQIEKLQTKQENLLKKAYKISHKNRKKSDKYISEANKISEQIDIILMSEKNRL